MTKIKHNFKINDRVFIRNINARLVSKLSTGTVVQIENEFNDVGLRLDEEHYGCHSCGGRTKERTGWYVHREDIELIDADWDV